MSSALMPTPATEAGSVTSACGYAAPAAIMRQVALDDIGDDDLVAVGEKFGGKVTADETVAAEDNVSHFEISLVCRDARSNLRAVFVAVASALRDQHGSDADEGDAGDAPGVQILVKDEIGEHRHRHIGEAEERIGEGQFDLRQHVEMRGHRDRRRCTGRRTPTG